MTTRRLKPLEQVWVTKQLGNVTAAAAASVPVAPFIGETGPVGSVNDVAAVSHKFVSAITGGAPVLTQPAVADLSGFGTGVATALAANVGSVGGPVVNGGALGTPSGGVATNLTGTAAGLTAGSVSTNANLTGDVTSSGNATTIKTSVTLTTPILGVAAATSINFGQTALAYYGVGTWTPLVGTATVVGDFSSTGTYTKIGDLAYVQGTGSGSISIAFAVNAYLAGLPFTAATSSAPAAAGFANATNAASTISVNFFINPGETKLYCDVGIGATTIVYFAGPYKA